MTFIYALCEPGTRTVRYIGKANDPKRRMRSHLHTTIKKNTPLGAWLRSGVRPELVVLREIPCGDWEMAEERYIRLARGCGMNLLNVGDGGEGVNHTPEVRAKLSAANKGKPKKAFTAKHCAAISAATQGPKHGMFGKSQTPEAREAISTRQLGRKRRGSASFFRGVFWDKKRNLWTSKVATGGLTYNLGRFEDEIDAAHAADRALEKLFGDTADLNFSVKRRE